MKEYVPATRLPLPSHHKNLARNGFPVPPSWLYARTQLSVTLTLTLALALALALILISRVICSPLLTYLASSMTRQWAGE